MEKLFLVRSSTEVVYRHFVELSKGFVLQQKVPPVNRKDFELPQQFRTFIDETKDLQKQALRFLSTLQP